MLKGFLVHEIPHSNSIVALEFEFTLDGQGLLMSDPIECSITHFEMLIKGYGISNTKGRHMVSETALFGAMYIVTNDKVVKREEAHYVMIAALEVMSGKTKDRSSDSDTEIPFNPN